jgi:branched-chain amino acid transport system permease protein
MNILPIILIDGITFASWLFLVSAGITFIFGVLRILNVAHGSLYAIGAYLGATFILHFAGEEQHSWISLPLLLLAAVVVGLTLSPLLERLFLRRVYGEDEVIGLLTTFALFLILEDVIRLIWGIEPYLVEGPFRLFGRCAWPASLADIRSCRRLLQSSPAFCSGSFTTARSVARSPRYRL